MVNSLPVTKHEDNRRILTEWVKDFPLRTCKVLEVKEDAVLGNHYHEKKEEIFFLFKGSGSVEMDEVVSDLKEGDVVFADRGQKHTFHLKAGSILLEAGTKPFDKSDDHS